MADSAVDVANPTGNADVRTESTNGNFRQVVVVGDPATNAGVAPVDATNGLAVQLMASAIIGALDDAAEDDPDAASASLLSLIRGVLGALQGSLPAGTAVIGKTGIDQTTPGTTDSVSLNATNNLVKPQAHTTGGWTPYKLLSAANTNATSLKASAGMVGGIQAFNLNASTKAYLKLYNKASSPDENDTPLKVIMIPENGGVVISNAIGIQFSTGIAFRLVTGVADNSTAAVAANEIVLNIDYK